MPAAAFAAITPLEVKFFSEDFKSCFVVIKIFVFHNLLRLHRLKIPIFYLCQMILVSRFLLGNSRINAIALFPFILVKDKQLRKDPVLLNHEKIHLRQQLELLVVFFYLWYIAEYYYWLFRLKNPHAAYFRISFEREAYANEHNFSYLKKRRFWNFLTYRR